MKHTPYGPSARGRIYASCTTIPPNRYCTPKSMYVDRAKCTTTSMCHCQGLERQQLLLIGWWTHFRKCPGAVGVSHAQGWRTTVAATCTATLQCHQAKPNKAPCTTKAPLAPQPCRCQRHGLVNPSKPGKEGTQKGVPFTMQQPQQPAAGSATCHPPKPQLQASTKATLSKPKAAHLHKTGNPRPTQIGFFAGPPRTLIGPTDQSSTGLWLQSPMHTQTTGYQHTQPCMCQLMTAQKRVLAGCPSVLHI